MSSKEGVRVGVGGSIDSEEGVGVDIGGFVGCKEGGNTSGASPKQVLKSWKRSSRSIEMKHSYQKKKNRNET